MDEQDVKIVPFPTGRNIVIDAGRLGTPRHIIYGLLEFDITGARQAIRQHKAETGESLSFTAFIVTCLGKAIASQPSVQAYRDWRNRLFLFSDVDVVIMIETEKDGVALPHIVRGANRKSFRQIHDEIRAVQAKPVRSEQKRGLAQWGARAPRFVRDLFYWGLRKNPRLFKKHAGTVVVTAVGMFGKGGGWGIGFLPMHTLGLTLGGIAQKPALENGQIVAREYLSVTLSFDHDIVDGAPAARFTEQLRELVESSYGLASMNDPGC